MDVDAEIARLRKGDVLHVKALKDLAHPQGTIKALLSRVEAIEKRRATIWEMNTGRGTPRDLRAMLQDAMPFLRKGLSTKQARANGSKRIGRPLKKRMDKKEAAVIWHDARIKTNRAALKQMKGWTLPQAYLHLGKSGREPGRRKR